jgi:hypothetical protein
MAASYRENLTPRISANQLAEYLLASPARRQTILRNARYAPTFLVIRYSAAKEAISRFLADDVRNKRILAEAVAGLVSLDDKDHSPAKKNDTALCIEAIKTFSTISDNRELSSLTFEPVTNQLPKLAISGVDVSITPNMISYRPKSEGRSVGAVIYQTSKAIAAANWRAEHSRNVSTLLWMLAEKHLFLLGEPDRKLCLTLDIFGKTITPAPANYKRKLNDLEAACAEISALWDRISPPADYAA